MVLVDLIVDTCINLYESIPKSGKPKAEEWTVISAVVGEFRDNKNEIKVLSLGTGTKCIGKSSMSPKGDILNDSHAEVIARRAFLKYLYMQIIQLNETTSSEVFFRKNEDFWVYKKDSVKFYFVTSMTPCGDASIILKESSLVKLNNEFMLTSQPLNLERELKRINSTEDRASKRMKTEVTEKNLNIEDIYRTGAKCLPNSSLQDSYFPGVSYHTTKAVRTKPGRGDPTLSLSCSDKIARWNSVGWQGALLSLFIKNPIFMEAIICGGNVPFSKESFHRAVNERVKKDSFMPIQIIQSQIPFPNVKTKEKKACPSSIIWCEADKETEVAVNGRKQGVTKKNLNKKVARVSVCKKELFTLFEKVLDTLPKNDEFSKILLSNSNFTSIKDMTYREIKLKAENYQKCWGDIKQNNFKVWSNKDTALLNFKFEDE